MCLSACGTVRSFSEPKTAEESWFYRGVRNDFSVIDDNLTPPRSQREIGKAALTALDLPLSAAADTVLAAPFIIGIAVFDTLTHHSDDDTQDTSTPVQPPQQVDDVAEMHRVRGDDEVPTP